MVALVEAGRDPLQILVDFAFAEDMDPSVRLQAAVAATPYFHPRLSMATVESTTTNVTVDAAAVMDRLVDRLARLAPPEQGDVIALAPEPVKDPAEAA